MPLDYNTPPTAEQEASLVNEALTVLDQANKHGLIAPTSASELDDLRGRAAMGLMDGPEAQIALNRILAVGPAADLALDAIAPIFDPTDVLEIRAFDPAGGGAVSTYGRLGISAERKVLADAINAANGHKNNYFGANPRTEAMLGAPRAAGSADVATRRVAFLDLDAKDAPTADPGWTRTRDELAALGPLLAVQSGNGSQVWLPMEPLTGEALAASAGPLAACMAQIGADNMADLVRVGRMPNTINLPTPAKRKRDAVPCRARGPYGAAGRLNRPGFTGG